MLPALTSAIKGFMSDNGDIEEFDGGLLKCAEPVYMENVKLINIIDAGTRDILTIDIIIYLTSSFVGPTL